MEKTKEEKKQKKEQFRRKAALVWQFLKGSRLLFIASILCTGVMSLCDMINPQIIRAAVDNAIGGKEPKFSDTVMKIVDSFGGFEYLGRHLWLMATAIVIVAAVRVLSQYLFRVSNTAASETLVKTMRDRLFSHIESLPFGWHRKNQTGDIIQRCTSDIDTMKNFVSEQLTSIFRIIIMLTLAIVFMLSMNPWLTLIAIAPMPVILVYSLLFHNKIASGFTKCDENEGILSAMAQENLTGVRVVRAFGRERYERDRFEKHNEYYTGLWVHMAKTMARFWSTSDIIVGLQMVLVVVCGVLFCINDKMTPGEYISFVSYNSLLVWPVRQLGRMISEMSKAGVSIDRIQYIMESEPEHDRPDACEPDMTGDISFNHVNFGYEGCPQKLFDVNFTIKSGTTLGILGGTGCGKSTLMSLLDRMYEIPEGNGSITIGGVDIRDIKASHLRKNIGMVLQEPFLFSRSISDNIAIALEDGKDMDKIREAAQAACLDETVSSFAKGYDTFVGERGVTLSGGQKQRTAIARTLIGNTPIMIFDDSLSAVDTETDAKIRASLQARFGTATIILISHRITTLCHADNIIVLDHGKIAEQGTHEQLKKAGGIYQRIYNIQSLSAEEASV